MSAIPLEQSIADLRPYLIRLARSRMRDAEAAEEVVQETLATALRAARSFEHRSQLHTWVTGILLHKVTDAFRAATRERELRVMTPEGDDEDADFDAQGHWRAPPAPWCDPEVALRSSRFRESFFAALSALPPKQARAFALREIDGLAAPDICRELGVSESNLWVLLFRARTALRRMLDRDALAPT